MKFKIVRHYDWDVDKSCDYFIEKELGYELTQLENVAMFKKIKRTDDGTIRKDIDEWCAHAQLPKALQAVISPKSLTWFAHSEWRRPTKTIFFRIEPIVLKDKVDCSGRTIFKSEGENKYLRDFEINLKVKLPVVGPIAEAFIIELLKKNEQQDHELCLKIMKSLKV